MTLACRSHRQISLQASISSLFFPNDNPTTFCLWFNQLCWTFVQSEGLNGLRRLGRLSPDRATAQFSYFFGPNSVRIFSGRGWK